MKETSIISQSIDFFVETKQAVIPQSQPTQAATFSKTDLETIKEEEKKEEKEKVIFTSQ